MTNPTRPATTRAVAMPSNNNTGSTSPCSRPSPATTAGSGFMRFICRSRPALGTIRSLETTVQGFEERAERLGMDITDAQKRAKEFGEKVGAKFEREERYQELTRRQSEKIGRA